MVDIGVESMSEGMLDLCERLWLQASWRDVMFTPLWIRGPPWRSAIDSAR